MNKPTPISTALNETSAPKNINVLWSGRSFGGAEIYVETMRRNWGCEIIALQTLSAVEMLRLMRDIAFGRNTYVFHDLRAALLGFLRPTRKYITVIHGPGQRQGLTRAVIRAQAFTQKAIVLVSDDIYPNRSNDRVFVLENFSSAGIKATDQSADAVFVGRVTRAKCVDKTVAFWHRYQPGGILHIIGDGDLLPELRTRYEIEGSNIRFHGAMPHEQITKIASTCRFYVSFSDREGLSLSLLEAMDGGLIPLVTNLPSQRFVFEIPDVPMVDEDGERLAQAIARINDGTAKDRATLRDAVRRTVRERFQERWLKVWEQLLGANPGT